jgi:multidrug resistance efflux pump
MCAPAKPVAVMESRDAASIAAERSSASANLALARSTYAREKKLFDAKVTARQDLEGAAKQRWPKLRPRRGARSQRFCRKGVRRWPHLWASSA